MVIYSRLSMNIGAKFWTYNGSGSTTSKTYGNA